MPHTNYHSNLARRPALPDDPQGIVAAPAFGANRYQYLFGRGAEHSFSVWVCALNLLTYSSTPGTKSHIVWHPECEDKHCKLNREADCLSSSVAEGVIHASADSPPPSGMLKFNLLHPAR